MNADRTRGRVAVEVEDAWDDLDRRNELDPEAFADELQKLADECREKAFAAAPDTEGSRLDYTLAVCQHLAAAGHDDAADWTLANHHNARAMGPAEVAAHADIPRDDAHIHEVAAEIRTAYAEQAGGAQ